MKTFNISPFNRELEKALQTKVDNKTKPIGSLGKLEKLAIQVGLIQDSLTPKLSNPTILVVAADHGITAQGVSPCPVEITWQQCLNFLEGGGGINMFCQSNGLDYYVVDAGVDYDFAAHPKLIEAKVRKGSRNIYNEPAMTIDECEKAISNGVKAVNSLHLKGCNVVGFGEMGIGNTSPASLLLSVITGLEIEKATGPGSGLDTNGVKNKIEVLKHCIHLHGKNHSPLETLAIYGGLEIATIAGGMLAAAENRMLILCDGFITTAALLAAQTINPLVTQYALFSHQSKEYGHQYMIDYLKGDAVLNLDLRLGEGTGAALAYSIVKGAVHFLNNMKTFEQAKVTDTTHIRGIEE